MLIHKIQKCEKMFMLKKSNWTQRRQKSWKTFEQLACKICTNWRIRSKSQLTKRLKCSVMRWKSYHWSFQSQRKSEIDQWIYLFIDISYFIGRRRAFSCKRRMPIPKPKHFNGFDLISNRNIERIANVVQCHN